MNQCENKQLETLKGIDPKIRPSRKRQIGRRPAWKSLLTFWRKVLEWDFHEKVVFVKPDVAGLMENQPYARSPWIDYKSKMPAANLFF
jgi:hypothetical protein